MEKKHQKHAKLKRPQIGKFGRNEFAFLGAPCGIISELSEKLIKQLGNNLNILYVDADHAAENTELSFNSFQDKITFQRFDVKNVNEIERKFLLQHQDLILVNGNHFEAQKQVVLIHPKKEESLKKRLAQLTNIAAFVLCDDANEIYDWLKEAVPNWSAIPSFKLAEAKELGDCLRQNMEVPKLKALVLSGGKSTRMGEDKNQIVYHGMAQQGFLLNQFKELGIEAFVSCREDQIASIESKYISDKFLGLGPYGGILSAFQEDPDAAWLVIACDLPFIRKQEISFLIEHRNPYKLATACHNPETDFPDPLFTIWEPKAYQSLLSYLSIGYSCPRKVLINSDIELLHLPDPKVLQNANTPEDKEEVLKELVSNKLDI